MDHEEGVEGSDSALPVREAHPVVSQVRRLSFSKFLNGLVGLDVEPLSITSGVVWTALNIDYPGHSFCHLGVFRGASAVSLKAPY
jgi:hypothetical protein